MFPRVRAHPALCFIFGLSIMAAGCVQQQEIAPEEPLAQVAPARTPANLITEGRYSEAAAAYAADAQGEDAATPEARLKAGLLDIYTRSLALHGWGDDEARVAELLAIDIELNAQGMGVWLDRPARA
jgi:hypothetical protein